MGKNVNFVADTPENREAFGVQLQANLTTDFPLWVPQATRNPRERRTGLEIELLVVLAKTLAPGVDIGPRLIAELKRHGITVTGELGNCVIELNGWIEKLSGRPWKTILDDADQILRLARTIAEDLGGTIMLGPGIMPLWPFELYDPVDPGVIIDNARYRMLIERTPPWTHTIRDVEGHTHFLDGDITALVPFTAHQSHLEVPADQLHDYYNAANIAVGLMAALNGNAPAPYGIMGEHSDYRGEIMGAMLGRRTFIGPRWTTSPADVIQALVDHVGGQSPFLDVEEGKPMSALQQFLSCIYPGARPRLRIDADDSEESDNSTRLELRDRSAGPTLIEGIADDVVTTALIRYLVEHIDEWRGKVDFRKIRANRVAANGPDGVLSKLTWMHNGRVRTATAREIWDLLVDDLRKVLPHHYYTNPAEVDLFFPYVDKRARTGQTASRWFRRTYDALRWRGLTPAVALHEATTLYNLHSDHGLSRVPVAQWPIPS